MRREPERPSFATPEDASLGDFPPQYVEAVGALVREDIAIVWLLINEDPVHGSYTVFCELRDGRWYEGDGVPGISYDPGMPDDVYERLHSLGDL